jgi:hypothetical protein
LPPFSKTALGGLTGGDGTDSGPGRRLASRHTSHIGARRHIGGAHCATAIGGTTIFYSNTNYTGATAAISKATCTGTARQLAGAFRLGR